MPRTSKQLEQAAADAEAWLDSHDPDTTATEDPADLRRIGLAARAVADAHCEVDDAVAEARANGRSWGEIGLVLGISRQSARERFSKDANHR